jgi:hypothetical protein
MSNDTTKNASRPRLAQDAPEGLRRRRILVVAALVVAAQMLVPATYYMGESDADERFAWRMFSNRRAESCQVQATERSGEGPAAISRRLRLSGLMHRAWIHGLSRRRPGIVEKFFSWRCEDPAVSQLALIRHCRSATGERLPSDTIEHRCERAP